MPRLRIPLRTLLAAVEEMHANRASFTFGARSIAPRVAFGLI